MPRPVGRTPSAQAIVRCENRRFQGAATAWQRFWLSLCALCLILPLTGCGGCLDSSNPNTAQKTPEEIERERKELQEKLKEAEKPPFELLQLRTRPSSLSAIDNATKLGHWGSATMDARSNEEDFNGEMMVEAVDQQGDPLTLERTTYSMSTQRPVQLAKKQRKNLEITYFAPTHIPSLRLRTSLLYRGGRSVGAATVDPLILMPEHQYHLVVLSATPDGYTFLKSIPTVRAPTAQFTDAAQAPHYRIHAPTVRNYVPLASSSLKWTTIAYLVWDDFQPGRLQLSQQEALVDWLHWGGQLVISGPKSLDTLKGSFLDPYLPCDAGPAWELNQAALLPINNAFRHRGPELSAKRPWSGVKLALRPEAAYLPNSGEMIAERRVGAGRIAVTAFSLTQRDLRTWPGVDELVNSWLLRRDARAFTTAISAGGVTVAWAEGNRVFAPEKSSQLRYFTRDWLTEKAREKHAQDQSAMDPLTQPGGFSPYGPGLMNDSGVDSSPPLGPGVAGWNDFSDAALRARESLITAAGIKVPKREFVLWVLGSYVLVLAPLNWVMFRVIRRVEWAWMAVPVLAIGFSIGVIRLAQLDIGFARSTTELAVVEIQGQHSKAHVTRYTAMYSSLASNYDLEFEDAGALALPLAAEANQLTGQSIRPVTYWRDSTVRFTDFAVASNSTGMVHSEHFLDLGGAIGWEPNANGGGRLTNGTKYELKGVGLVRRAKDSENLEVAWLGDLAASAAGEATFRAASEENGDDLFLDKRESAPQTNAATVAGRLNVHQLIELAETTLAPGETRLIAWTEQLLPGLKIDPPAPQNRQLSLVVAHLDRGELPAAQLDSVAWLDVAPENARILRGDEEDEE